MIKKIDNYKGIGTGLVTFIIPKNKPVSETVSLIVDEIGKTTNIKDWNNAKAVVDSLNGVKEKLKNYKTSGNTGMVIFSGNVLIEETQQEKWICHLIQPPKDIQTKLFYCGDSF